MPSADPELMFFANSKPAHGVPLTCNDKSLQ